ncbi:MAG: amidase [Rhodothalassiaceae bacterium]
MLTRRSVLAGGVAGAALPIAALGQEIAKEVDINLETLRQAEKLHGVRFTDAEREQVLRRIEDQIDQLAALRALDPPNDLAPALSFDPRLPGRAYGAPGGGVSGLEIDQSLPGSDADLAFAPAAHQAHWIRTGQLSSRELTELYLRRIDRFAPRLENFVTVTADLALEQADAADRDRARGLLRSPLHGVPYGLKDLMDTAGIRTSWGAAPYQDRVAQSDGIVTERLAEAGCPLLGKTTLGALAYGDIWFGGVTRNPWSPQEGSSGSSAGSASATAAGLVGFSIGTETLGSIITPSNRCGTTGLRPSFGRVARTGAMALCWSLDKIGPICRSVADTALVLQIINGAHPGDPASLAMPFGWRADQGGDVLRVGYDPAWFEEAAAPDRAALDALRSIGATLVEIQTPDLPLAPLVSNLVVEAAAAFEELTLSDQDDLMTWQEDRAWPNSFRTIRFRSAVDYVQADRLRRRLMQEMAALFDDLDALISPSFAGGLLTITNFTGSPALTLRAGFIETPPRTLFGQPQEEDAAPVRVPHNVTLWAPMFREDALLTLGHALEARLNVASAQPPLG